MRPKYSLSNLISALKINTTNTGDVLSKQAPVSTEVVSMAAQNHGIYLLGLTHHGKCGPLSTAPN